MNQMLEEQSPELFEKLFRQSTSRVQFQAALELFSHVYEENQKLKAELVAIKESPTNDTILMMRNAALDTDLARANKRLEAWTAIGRRIAATNDGIDSLKKVQSHAAREILSLGFMVSLEGVIRDAAELYRVQQGQKPAKTEASA